MVGTFPVKKKVPPRGFYFSVLLGGIKGARKQSQMGCETKEPGEMQLDRRQPGEHPWRHCLSRLE